MLIPTIPHYDLFEGTSRIKGKRLHFLPFDVVNINARFTYAIQSINEFNWNECLDVGSCSEGIGICDK